jgi:glycosyltransferase involved in cell wall biosynthesis
MDKAISGEKMWVSVIIPCYNQGQFLAEAIDSALAQTYAYVEVIVVNDGSTDCTADVCKHYAGRIKYVEQANRGRSAARNHGVRISCGDWLQFLDADDLLHRRKLEWQMQDIVESGASVGTSCTAYYRKSVFDEIVWCQYPGHIQNMFLALADLSLSPPLLMHAVIVRRDAFNKSGGFLDDWSMAEDRMLFVQLIADGNVFCFSPVVGAFYRQHQSTTPHDDLPKSVSALLRVLRKFWEIAENTHLQSENLRFTLLKSLTIVESRCVGKSGCSGTLRDAVRFHVELCEPEIRTAWVRLLSPQIMRGLWTLKCFALAWLRKRQAR